MIRTRISSWWSSVGLLLDTINEFAGNLEMDVGGEQGGTDFPERISHVGLGQFADAAQVAES